MEKNEFFVVLAFHDTDGMPLPDVVQLTADVKKAVATARDIERFGYEFSEEMIGCGIFRLEPEMAPYRYEELGFSAEGEENPPHAFVFGRYHLGKGNWEEKWFNEDLKKLVDG